MSVAAVFGPGLATLAEAVRGAATGAPEHVRVRGADETPARRAAALRDLFSAGVETVLLVDRAMPVRPDWMRAGGPFALVADHVNLTGENPLVGPNADEWGPRFPDLTDAWDPELRRAIRRAAVGAGHELREGVVAGVPAGTRTAAELSMLRMLGADMAGDGFVHEAIVARHAGRRVAGLAMLAVGAELPGELEAAEDLVRTAVAALAGAGVRAE